MAIASTDGTSYEAELQAAVHAHNAAANSVTGIAPEEIMLGRKIMRGLPLLDRAKINVDDELLNQKDRDSKLRAKYQADNRRHARECLVKPGDNVVVERQHRSKGETRFSLKRYTVLEENNGNLLLVDDDGVTMKRHVSQTKKIYAWRNSERDHPNNEYGGKGVDKRYTVIPGTGVDVPMERAESSEGTVSTQQSATEEGGTGATSAKQRPMRDKRAPAYLDHYVRSMEGPPQE